MAYDHDLIIDRGKIRKRRKGASRQFRGGYGHTPLSAAEDIGALAALCGERRDGNPRADANTAWGGARLPEMRTRHRGSWRPRTPEPGRACVIGVPGR